MLPEGYGFAYALGKLGNNRFDAYGGAKKPGKGKRSDDFRMPQHVVRSCRKKEKKRQRSIPDSLAYPLRPIGICHEIVICNLNYHGIVALHKMADIKSHKFGRTGSPSSSVEPRGFAESAAVGASAACLKKEYAVRRHTGQIACRLLQTIKRLNKRSLRGFYQDSCNCFLNLGSVIIYQLTVLFHSIYRFPDFFWFHFILPFFTANSHN